MSEKKYMLLNNNQPGTFLVNLRPKNKINIPNNLTEEIKSKLKDLIETKKQKLSNSKTFGTPIFVYKTERNKEGKKEYVIVTIKNNKTSLKTSSKPFVSSTTKKKKEEITKPKKEELNKAPVATNTPVSPVSPKVIINYLNKISKLTYVSPEKPIDNPGQKCFIIASYHLLFSIFWMTDKKKLILESNNDSQPLSSLIEKLLTDGEINKQLVNEVTDELISKNLKNVDLQKFKNKQCDSHEFLTHFFNYFNNTYEQIKSLITFNTLEKYVLEDKSSSTYTNIKTKLGKTRTKTYNQILIVFNNDNDYTKDQFYSKYPIEKNKNKYFYITKAIKDDFKFKCESTNNLYDLNSKMNLIKGLSKSGTVKPTANKLCIEAKIEPLFTIKNKSNINDNQDLLDLISTPDQQITKGSKPYNAGTVFKEECNDCQIIKDPNIFIKNIYYIKPIDYNKPNMKIIILGGISSLNTKNKKEDASKSLVKKYYTKILDDFLEDVSKIDLNKKDIDTNFVIHLVPTPNNADFDGDDNKTNAYLLEAVNEWKKQNLKKMKEENLKGKTITISLGYDELTKNNLYRNEILENKIEDNMLQLEIEDKDMNIEEVLNENLKYEDYHGNKNIFVKNLNAKVGSLKNNIRSKKYLMNLPQFLILQFKTVYFNSSTSTRKKNNKFYLTNNLTDIITLKELQPDLSKENDVEYLIQDIIYHKGNSANSGHYVCLSRRKEEKEPQNSKSKTSPTEKWYLYNDSNVSVYKDNTLKIKDSNPVLVLLKKV